MHSTYSIDPDQPKHAEQANPDRHFSHPVDFLFQESLLYTSIHLRRNVSARISLRRLRRLIWIDTLRRGTGTRVTNGCNIFFIFLTIYFFWVELELDN